MKKSKKNYAIIVLIVLLLALAVGYAAFSASLTINGTVKADAEWDVKFTAGTITGDETDDNQVTFTDTVMTVKAELGFPGDGRQITATISNAGSVDAKLKALTVTSPTDTDLIFDFPDIEGETLSAGEDCVVTFTVQWDEDSEKEEITDSFTVELEYEQNTEAVNVTPGHVNHT